MLPGFPAADAFTLDDLTPALLVGTLVLLVSVAAVRLSVKSGLPSLLIYLAIGLAISLIFGILVSTVLTLVVIPLLYFVAYRRRPAVLTPATSLGASS